MLQPAETEEERREREEREKNPNPLGLMDMEMGDFAPPPPQEERGIAPEPQYENRSTQSDRAVEKKDDEESEELDLVPVEKKVEKSKKEKEEKKERELPPGYKPYTGVGAERPKKWKKDKELQKTKEQLADEYWADKSEKKKMDNEQWHQEMAELSEKVREERATTMSEGEAYEQAKQRLPEIQQKVQEATAKVKEIALSPLMDEKEAKAFFKQKLKEQQESGPIGEMKEIKFPKTAYSDPFSKWVFVRPQKGAEASQLFTEIYKLKMNYNDIKLSMEGKKQRDEASKGWARQKELDEMIKNLESPSGAARTRGTTPKRREAFVNRFEVFYK